MGLYSEAILDEIRNSVSIVSLVSEYLTLKKRGRNHIALCPFHNEKTPSFNVNEERQIFRCFGCGEGGDAFNFLMRMEQISFPESIRILAERQGIALPEPTRSGPAEPHEDLTSLRRIMQHCADYYHDLLLGSDDAAPARRYLERRGIDSTSIERFHLGYAPAGGGVTLRHLEKAGFTSRSLLDCGLIKRSDEGGRLYDAFRGRIMVPIRDVRGRVIAFGGRALGDVEPKYLNSPETKLYNKSRNLFGLGEARDAIKKAGSAILVEGYFDLIAPVQHGVSNIVASLGTSLTPQQVQLLGRYTRDVVVCYDPDVAGQSAAQRSIDIFLEQDFSIRVLSLPAGQDPDTFIREQGSKEFRAGLSRAPSYLDFVLESAIARQGTLEGPRDKVQVLNAILPYLAKLPNAVERSDYVFRLARRLQIEDRLILSEVKKAARQRKKKLPEEPLEGKSQPKFAEKRLLQVLLGNGSLQGEILPNCSVKDFEGLATEEIFSSVLELWQTEGTATYDQLHQRFAGQETQSLLAKMQMEDVPEGFSVETAESFFSALRKMRLSSFKDQILLKIAEAERQQDDEMLDQLIQQRTQLDRELVHLSRK